MAAQGEKTVYGLLLQPGKFCLFNERLAGVAGELFWLT
jgi:hypothetical protein